LAHAPLGWVQSAVDYRTFLEGVIGSLLLDKVYKNIEIF